MLVHRAVFCLCDMVCTMPFWFVGKSEGLKRVLFCFVFIFASEFFCLCLLFLFESSAGTFTALEQNSGTLGVASTFFIPSQAPFWLLRMALANKSWADPGGTCSCKSGSRCC